MLRPGLGGGRCWSADFGQSCGGHNRSFTLGGVLMNRMPATSSRERRVGSIVLALIGGLGLLLALVATITSGFAGFVLLLGLTLLILGVGAVIVGRPGWALIASRKAGCIVLALGLGFTLFSAAIAPAAPSVAEPQPLV